MSALQQAWRSSRDGDPGWRIKFGYEADTIEQLKARVPHWARTWDEQNKEWWIHQDYESEILCLFPDFRAFLEQPRLFS